MSLLGRPMGAFREESDSMGTVQVPEKAYYGAQTQRAVDNFSFSNLVFAGSFLQALGLIKQHAAETNQALGLLDGDRANAIIEAAKEMVAGKWNTQFVVDVFHMP